MEVEWSGNASLGVLERPLRVISAEVRYFTLAGLSCVLRGACDAHNPIKLDGSNYHEEENQCPEVERLHQNRC